MVAGEIAAKHGDLQQVSGERGPLEARSRSGRVDPVERSPSRLTPVRIATLISGSSTRLRQVSTP